MKKRCPHDPQTRTRKTDPVKITAEGIWRDGMVRTVDVHWPGCSTGVAQSRLGAAPDEFGDRVWRDTPWLTRILHDGALVREFNSETGKYTLAMDGGCCTIPDGAKEIKVRPPKRRA